jgi:hypothetical protein
MKNLGRLCGRLPAAVWLVLVLAHALAFAQALRTGHYAFPDSGRYVQAAHNLRQHGQLYARPWPAQPPQGQAVQEFTIRPPSTVASTSTLSRFCPSKSPTGGRASPPSASTSSG